MRLYFHEAGTTYRGMMGYAHAGSTYMGIWDNSSNVDPTLVCQTGEVGIGTNSPATKLTVHQSADDNGLRIYGYDDVAARYAELFVNSAGYTVLDASTDRGLALKGHGIDFYVNSGGTHIGRWTFGGNLGVGCTDPTSRLTVEKTSTATTLSKDGTVLMLRGADGADKYSHIGFTYDIAGDVQPSATIGIQLTSWTASTKSDLVFGTRDVTTDTAPTERMRITSAGNVGIGTTAPGAKLHVYGGNIRISSTNDKPQLEFFETAAARWVIGHSTAPNNYFAISEGSDVAVSERLVIAPSTGSVGIGTTAPGAKLNVAGGAIRVDNTASTVVRLHLNNSGTNDYASIYADTAAAYKNLILNPSGGKVGIGTAANLNSIFNVYGATSSGPTSIITCMSADATVGGGAGIFFKSSNNTTLNRYGAQISVIRSSNDNGSPDLIFNLENANATGLAERMRILSDGKVGIGTTNPGQLLEVGNDGNSDYALIGPTKIGGGMGHGDYAGFSHRSMGGTSNYCLLQYSDGNTYLNAASGKTVHLRVNNSNILKVTGSLATFDVGALFNGYIELDAGLKDKDGSFGTNGYVLTTDGSGDVTWAASPGAGSVTGTGTNNYIASWNGTTALETANIYKHAYGTIINSNFLSSYATNRYVFEVAGNPGTGDFDGGIINLRVASNTNNERVGQLAFINSANANHVNPNSTVGSRIAQIISTVATSDSNAGDDSGGDLQFWTKPEAGLPAERMRISSAGLFGIGSDLWPTLGFVLLEKLIH